MVSKVTETAPPIKKNKSTKIKNMLTRHVIYKIVEFRWPLVVSFMIHASCCVKKKHVIEK